MAAGAPLISPPTALQKDRVVHETAYPKIVLSSRGVRSIDHLAPFQLIAIGTQPAINGLLDVATPAATHVSSETQDTPVSRASEPGDRSRIFSIDQRTPSHRSTKACT